MRITELELEGVLLVEAVKHGDERGFFSETFRKKAFAEAGFSRDFVQDNQSFSTTPFTIRGLHFQAEPHAQDKLIRATRGAVLDVAVDIRPSSTTFGRHVAVELSAANARQLLVPRGFAHGYQTLTEECEVQYKVTDYYAPAAEGGVRWDDPELAIEWAESDPTKVTVNGRDASWPAFGELKPK